MLVFDVYGLLGRMDWLISPYRLFQATSLLLNLAGWAVVLSIFVGLESWIILRST